MTNTFSSVPYEKTAQQRSIANRLEPIAIRYWQHAENLCQASQALVNTDVNDAPKFRDACTAVGLVLVSTGLSEYPLQIREERPQHVGVKGDVCWAIGDLLDSALKRDWVRFSKTYEWIIKERDSMLLFDCELFGLVRWLMTQRYIQIAPACYAEAQSIADEYGEVFAALQRAPYYGSVSV